MLPALYDQFATFDITAIFPRLGLLKRELQSQLHLKLPSMTRTGLESSWRGLERQEE